MFECFDVPACYTTSGAYLAAYACGRGTCIVLDIGDTSSHIIPIYEGHTFPQAVQRLDISGRDLTSHLQKLLSSQGYSFSTGGKT